MELHQLLSACPLDDLTRIDVGLEGNWSPTVTTVWTRDAGRRGLTEVVREHGTFKPCVEIYFVDAWIGLHSFNRVEDSNVFDEAFLERVIQAVESAVASDR